MMKLIPRIEHGFDFQCRRCGRCCSASNEGMIFVFPKDIENLATFFKISKAELAQKYLCIVNYNFHIWDENLEDSGEKITLPTLVLDSNLSADCIFLKSVDNERRCSVYTHRPFQCRAYPCWTMFVNRTDEMFLSLSNECLGFKITPEDASRYPIDRMQPDQIQAISKQERQIERDYVQLMHKFQDDLYSLYPFLCNAGDHGEKFTRSTSGIWQSNEKP